jgi:cell division protein ZapA (FtsZ GTPase activity inhibitor)
MNRVCGLALGMVLILASHAALGQHGGHGSGGGSRGGAPRGTGSTSDSSLQDFNHALAVQATPDQASRFQSLAKSTEDARKQAQDLLRLAAKADNPAEFSKHVAALKDAVEAVQGDNKFFVKNLSKSQKSELKELTKKLDKADSEVTKQKKALDQRLGLPQGDDEGIASLADKMEKALAELQAQQLSLGKEMGIQVPAT